MKQNCDAGRQWGFVTFSTANEAMSAQEQTNGLLTFQNSSRPCEVTLARNQGGGRPPPVDTGPKKAGSASFPMDLGMDRPYDPRTGSS